jgi:hypothetical protein
LLNRFAAGCTIPTTRPASCQRASGKWGRAESQATAPMTTRLLRLREMDHVLLRSIRNVQCRVMLKSSIDLHTLCEGRLIRKVILSACTICMRRETILRELCFSLRRKRKLAVKHSRRDRHLDSASDMLALLLWASGPPRVHA